MKAISGSCSGDSKTKQLLILSNNIDIANSLVNEIKKSGIKIPCSILSETSDRTKILMISGNKTIQIWDDKDKSIDEITRLIKKNI